jgi:hypothetical protein
MYVRSKTDRCFQKIWSKDFSQHDEQDPNIFALMGHLALVFGVRHAIQGYLYLSPPPLHWRNTDLRVFVFLKF